jgi:hypothetical protein
MSDLTEPVLFTPGTPLRRMSERSVLFDVAISAVAG